MNGCHKVGFHRTYLSLLLSSFLCAPVLAQAPINPGTSQTIADSVSFDSADLLTEDDKYARYIVGARAGDKVTLSFSGKEISAVLTEDKLADLKGNDKFGPTLTIFGAPKGTLNLGGENTQSVKISVKGKLPRGTGDSARDPTVYGIRASESGIVNITANTLDINIDVTTEGESGGIYGLLADNSGKINVNADTIINVSGPSSAAISAMSKGSVTLNGDLYVNQDNSRSLQGRAIVARGDSSVVINPDKNKVVQMTGNVDFNFNQPTSGTSVNSKVEINLNGSSSFWNGSAQVTADTGSEADLINNLKERNLTLNVSDGAVWAPTAVNIAKEGTHYSFYSPVNQLALDNGVVDIKNNNQAVVVENLKGQGTINVQTSKAGDELSSGSFIVGQTKLTTEGLELEKKLQAEDGTHLDVNFTGVTSDEITPEDLKLLAENVQVDNATQTQTVAEGLINGEMKQEVDTDGNIISTTTDVNTVNQSIRDIGAMTFLGFRTAINDLDKRLGDLRSYSGENGAWIRYLGGQNRYGSRNMKLNYNGFQAGFDHRLGDFYGGLAFGYTKGDGHLKNGSSDNDNWNFGLYGGWMGEKGQFVDVIVKRHRFKNEFSLHNNGGLLSGGSYHNWATSVSAEAGWRLSCPTTGFYAEPQVELSFGRMEKGSFTTSQGVKVQQDAINSTVGRLGVAAGYTLPESKGNAYVKASVLHDWSAKVKGSMSKAGLKQGYRDDLSGTWAEFSVGGTYNATKNISAYGEFQTSAGSPVRSPWSASVGLRYNF